MYMYLLEALYSATLEWYQWQSAYHNVQKVLCQTMYIHLAEEFDAISSPDLRRSFTRWSERLPHLLGSVVLHMTTKVAHEGIAVTLAVSISCIFPC